MKRLRLSVLSFVLCLMVLSAALPAFAGQNKPIEETARLAALAKVWGLLKYYHPEVAKGEMDWDSALITAVPAVKAALDKESFNQEIGNLIIEAGGIDIADYNPGTPANPDRDKVFRWIKDNSIFSSQNRKKLETLRKKHIPHDNYYVQPYEDTLHPNFENEKSYGYGDDQYPDENLRLLALFRYWNIIQYFFPYKADIGEPWEPILDEYLPRIQHAGDALEYHLTFRELVGRLHDGHAFCYSPTIFRHFGFAFAPFDVKYIDGRTIVSRVYTAFLPQPGLVRPGDIIIKCHGQDIHEFREERRKYAHAGNELSTQHNISEYHVLCGPGATPVLSYRILRDGVEMDIEVPKKSRWALILEGLRLQQAQGKWKILPGNIGYVHLGNLLPEEVDTAMSELMNTRGIIFELRAYPEWTHVELGRWLNPAPVPFAVTWVTDWDLPGAFMTKEPIMTSEVSNPDYYRGHVVALIDETSLSYPEYYSMALRATPRSTLIGAPTAGSDGDFTGFTLPGGIDTSFAGVGVSYPDGSPTQRVGVVPDIAVRPTQEGLRDGRDEVMEFAVSYIQNN